MPRTLSKLLLIGAASAALADTCKRLDGPDKAAPPNEGGRGISDWNQHLAWAQADDRAKLAGERVSGRLATLEACGDQAAYARVYADVSVLIAHHGRAGAGWKDAPDPAAPKEDPGRGVGSWTAHQEHVLKGAGMANAHTLVGRAWRRSARPCPSRCSRGSTPTCRSSSPTSPAPIDRPEHRPRSVAQHLRWP